MIADLETHSRGDLPGDPVVGSPRKVCFDIETGPLPLPELKEMMPEFEAPSNYKDEEKIAKVIESKRLAWIEKAALDARTGRVLAIGYTLEGQDGVQVVDDSAGEAVLLEHWWKFYRKASNVGAHWIGHNIRSFDFPFLIRRSLKHGVCLPAGLLVNGLRYDRLVVDLMEIWACGDFKAAFMSLDNLAKFLGVGAKNGNGKDFYTLYKTDQEKAFDYLRNDVRLVKQVWEKIGW
jgi:hypothetical protein